MLKRDTRSARYRVVNLSKINLCSEISPGLLSMGTAAVLCQRIIFSIACIFSSLLHENDYIVYDIQSYDVKHYHI